MYVLARQSKVDDCLASFNRFLADRQVLESLGSRDDEAIISYYPILVYSQIFRVMKDRR